MTNFKLLAYAFGPSSRVARLDIRDRITVNRIKRVLHIKLAVLLLVSMYFVLPLKGILV